MIAIKDDEFIYIKLPSPELLWEYVIDTIPIGFREAELIVGEFGATLDFGIVFLDRRLFNIAKMILTAREEIKKMEGREVYGRLKELGEEKISIGKSICHYRVRRDFFGVRFYKLPEEDQI